MGGKSGGGADAGPMLQYGNKALALQEKIYEEGKAANAPYQAAGGAGLNELMMRLGLGGGQSATAKTEAQLRKELAPSYTSTPSTTSNYYVSPDGRLIDASQTVDGKGSNFGSTYAAGRGTSVGQPGYEGVFVGMPNTTEGRIKALEGQGYKPYATPTTSVDNSGLDAAVQKALAEQATTADANKSNPLYGSLLDTFSMDNFQADPGYQFRLSEGNKALDRSLAASGQYLTPERQKALVAYNQDMGAQEFGNAYGRFNSDQGNIYNRLAGIAGIGQTALAQNQQAGQQYGQSASDLYTGMGNSIVAANQAKQANKGSMFNTLLGTAGQLGSAYIMSDIRLKEDIIPIGQENGHNIYTFRYSEDVRKGIDNPLIGVMAQEVLETHPDAVQIMPNGFYGVNYDAIGVKPRSAVSCH